MVPCVHWMVGKHFKIESGMRVEICDEYLKFGCVVEMGKNFNGKKQSVSESLGPFGTLKSI